MTCVDHRARSIFRRLLIIGAICSARGAGAAPTTDLAWNCTFSSKVQCEGERCAPSTPTIHLIIYPKYEVYQRCDKKGCDDYRAQFTRSGAFLVAELPGRGAFVKISDDLAATEVVTLGHAVIVDRGQCKEGAPPLIVGPSH